MAVDKRRGGSSTPYKSIAGKSAARLRVMYRMANISPLRSGKDAPQIDQATDGHCRDRDHQAGLSKFAGS